MLRRLLVVTVALAGLAAVAAPRVLAAAPPCPDPRPQSLQSQHFVVTFETDTSKGDAITSTQAGRVLASAERAYSAYAAMGFPAPASFAGVTEIDVDALASLHIAGQYCVGAFQIDSGEVDSPDLDYELGFSVFTEIEIAGGVSSTWLLQGAGSWASWSSLGYPSSSIADLGPWDMSLDCYPPLLHQDWQTCSTVGYENLGQSKWLFYEYLYETYGVAFIKELINDSVGGVSGLTALTTALGAHGTTVAAAYSAFSTKLMVGGWGASLLNTALPPVDGSPILTGAATGNTSARDFGVNRLATKYVEVDRGDGDAKHKCYTATLTINVTLPAGVTSQPVFYWAAANSSPVPLTVNGTSATTSVPWDTCTWSTHGYLSLPNTTTTVDGALFRVSTHLDVTTNEVTATPPSTPANGYGNPTDVSSLFGVPAISVFGPLVLKLPATATAIELVVEASEQGSLGATLGSLDLGKKGLVPGENVVKFTLPKGALATLRSSSAAGSNVLTLTPASSDGQATGAPVKVTVSVLPAKKAAKKPAKKPAKKKH